MLKLTRKQACAVALSAVFSLAVFSAPVFSAMELPVASSAAPSEDPFPGGIYSEPAAPSDPGSPVSETPAVSVPDSGGVSLPPVASGEPGENVSGGIEPTPDDPSSAGSGDSSGTDASSSEAVSSEAPPAPSSWPSVEPETPSYQEPSVTNPDTDQNLIDQLASQAAQANSDPDVLTSQDWSELLSQAESSGAESEDSSSGALLPEEDEDDGTSSGMTASTRSSWLLPVGVVLILLAVAGIGAFVYLQFILPRRRPSAPDPLTGARTDPSVDDSFRGPSYPDDGEEEGYVDVSAAASPSSHSYTGSPYDDDPYAEYARAKEEAAAAQAGMTPEQEALANQETMELSAYELQQKDVPSGEMEDVFSSDETEQLIRSGGSRQTQLPVSEEPSVPQESAPFREPAPRESAAPQPAPQEPVPERPKAQATPVSPDAAKPFDWDKFFDE